MRKTADDRRLAAARGEIAWPDPRVLSTASGAAFAGLGRITQQVGQDGTSTYAYDAKSQLTSATHWYQAHQHGHGRGDRVRRIAGRPGRPIVHSPGRQPLVHGPREPRSPGRATVVRGRAVAVGVAGRAARTRFSVALPGLPMGTWIRVQGLRASLRDALTPGYGRTPLRGVLARDLRSTAADCIEVA
jgi:YD repeat-containing protein